MTSLTLIISERMIKTIMARKMQRWQAVQSFLKPQGLIKLEPVIIIGASGWQWRIPQDTMPTYRKLMSPDTAVRCSLSLQPTEWPKVIEKQAREYVVYLCVFFYPLSHREKKNQDQIHTDLTTKPLLPFNVT